MRPFLRIAPLKMLWHLMFGMFSRASMTAVTVPLACFELVVSAFPCDWTVKGFGSDSVM